MPRLKLTRDGLPARYYDLLMLVRRYIRIIWPSKRYTTVPPDEVTITKALESIDTAVTDADENETVMDMLRSLGGAREEIADVIKILRKQANAAALGKKTREWKRADRRLKAALALRDLLKAKRTEMLLTNEVEKDMVECPHCGHKFKADIF